MFIRPLHTFIFNIIPMDYSLYKQTALNHDLTPMNSNFYIFGYKSKMILINTISIIALIAILVILFLFISLNKKIKTK